MPIRLSEVGIAKPPATLLATASGRSSARLVPGRDPLAGFDRFFLPLSHLRIPLPGIPWVTRAGAHFRSTLLLLAIAAEARPGHGLQPGRRDGLFAALAHSKSLTVDPGQRLLDCSQ